MGGTVRMGGVETIMSYTSLLRVKGQFETVKSSTKLLLPAFKLSIDDDVIHHRTRQKMAGNSN